MAERVKGEKPEGLLKCPSGVGGLDQIMGGGLPCNRPTLVCGGAGSGKTLLALQFIVNGIRLYDEPGVFLSFEETEEELARNSASLGFDLQRHIRQRKLMMDYVRVERHEIEETGEYDLEGLFIRIDHAIKKVRAKRVVLDTLESLFAGLANQSILRAEFRRLFRWLKEQNVTSIITAEAGENDAVLTRQGMEEYVSDCVIRLENRLRDQLTTRRLRVVKYRGSAHGTNEYPFLIDGRGINVLPVTSLKLEHPASLERVSTGLPRLDYMLGGKGYYRGSSVLISGTAGTGKSAISATFAAASCERGEKTLYFAFEEGQSQILRNMKSIGLDLARHVKKGMLRFINTRPTYQGLEMHLATMIQAIQDFSPSAVVVDPITNLFSIGNKLDVRSMLMRLIDFLKARQITGIFTSLTPGSGAIDEPEVGVSSLMDTWLLVRLDEINGERNRTLYVLKSRGMGHSNQLREFAITSRGIDLRDIYVGPGGVLTGAAREAQEARDLIEEQARSEERQRKHVQMKRNRAALDARIEALRAEYEALQQALQRDVDDSTAGEQARNEARSAMAVHRRADPRSLNHAPKRRRG